MLRKSEQHIRKCYEAFLDLVPEDRDLWEIALLEYYRRPLERWRTRPREDGEEPIPACFADLAPELPRLAARKKELRPSGGAQLCLERRCGRSDSGTQQTARRTLPPEAVGLLLEYRFLTAAQPDSPGSRSCRTLFEEEDDGMILKRIVRHGVRKPEEQLALALRMREFRTFWQLDRFLDEEELDWLTDLVKELLEGALLAGCGQAAWPLYEQLREAEWFSDPWEPLDLLRRAAEAGSADARCEMGWQFFLHVMGLPPENREGYCGDRVSGEEALRWMEAALPHRIDTVPYLAGLLLDGKGVPADEARAVRALTAATAGRHEGDSAFAEWCTCFRMLAECHAEGRGVPKDRRKAAELYRQAQDSGYYLFDCYRDGAEVPRNPRAAVRYWMRDTCFHHGLLLWAEILTRVSAPEGCVRLRPEDLRSVWRLQTGKNAFYDLMGTDLLGTAGRRDDPYALLCGLLEREKARLLWDGAQSGDSRCGDILKKMPVSGGAARELLAQLTSNAGSVRDWPDSWYEEALERIEGQLAREARTRCSGESVPREAPAWEGLWLADGEEAGDL
ncbi:tetratricopeptide repeat protein [Dysosmobacter sp.]|uniref:tetratricopeptide repeat protein n=1 Tax=Dysosmobacter sp. TaxID=2591382 RepID=UPI002A8AA535|nr:hypothetical protein [Dysosmobacter sp.]MDY3281208.1 hypothetical protein [Dysosmobacter sp.]